MGVFSTAEALQQQPGGHLAHLPERLPNCRNRRPGKYRDTDIVETHHRDVLRRMQACIADGANRSECRNVVEADDRREVRGPLQQVLYHGIAQLRGGNVLIELNHQRGGHADVERLRGCPCCLPAHGRIRAGLLTANDRDTPMTQ